MRGLTRATFGSLPPAYDGPWDSDHARRAHPGTGALPMPPLDPRVRRLREEKQGMEFVSPR